MLLVVSRSKVSCTSYLQGFTAMDIACSTRNVPLLRRLEQCAPYVGWLLMKVGASVMSLMRAACSSLRSPWASVMQPCGMHADHA